MPVILTAEAGETWLLSDVAPAELKELLVPFPAPEMKSFPVSSRVNHAEVNDVELVKPIEIEEMTTGMLFELN